MGVMTRVKNFISDLRTEGNYDELSNIMSADPTYSAVKNRTAYSKESFLLREIPEMLQFPIINSALASYMESAFQIDNNQRICIPQSDYPIIKKELDNFHRMLSMDDYILLIGYNCLVNGNLPIKLEFTPQLEFKRLRIIPDYRDVVPFIISNKILGFKYKDIFFDSFEFVYAQFLYYKHLSVNQQLYLLQSHDLTNDIINEFVYAPSYLSPAVKPFRSIKIIEEALLMQRLDHSNFFRLIKVMVGDNVFAKNSMKYLSFIRGIMKKARRTSFSDDGGMASTSFGNEFDLVLPESPSQKITVDSIGGNVEIKAIKDLELQYKNLFSALRLQPEHIGFSFEGGGINIGGGENLSSRWDERYARTVKALVYSVSRAVKQIDLIYLRSKGFDVTLEDFKLSFLSTSTIEDEERSKNQKLALENLDLIKNTMDNFGYPYDSKYLLKSFLKAPLASSSVDIDLLLNDKTSSSDAVSSEIRSDKNIKSGKSFIYVDRSESYKELHDLNILSDSVYKDFLKENQEKHQIVSQFRKSTIDYSFYQSSIKICSENDFNVNLSSVLRQCSIDKSKFKRKKSNINIPTINSIASNIKEISSLKLDSGLVSPLSNVYILSSGEIYLEDEDLINYLYLVSSGYRTVFIKNLYVENE